MDKAGLIGGGGFKTAKLQNSAVSKQRKIK